MLKKIKKFINPDVSLDSISAYTMMKYRTVLTKEDYYNQLLEQINDSIKSKSIAGLPSTIVRTDITMPDITDSVMDNLTKRGYYCEVLNLKTDQFIYINWGNENSLSLKK